MQLAVTWFFRAALALLAQPAATSRFLPDPATQALVVGSR